MKFSIENGTVTIYGVPTVAQLKYLVNSLDYNCLSHKVKIEVISPDERKLLTMLPALQILEQHVADGLIRQTQADEAINYLKSLPLEEIEKAIQAIQSGTLSF